MSLSCLFILLEPDGQVKRISLCGTILYEANLHRMHTTIHTVILNTADSFLIAFSDASKKKKKSQQIYCTLIFKMNKCTSLKMSCSAVKNTSTHNNLI